MNPTVAPVTVGPEVSVETQTPAYTWKMVPGATSYDLYTRINGTPTTVTYTASEAGCSISSTCVINQLIPLVGGDSVYWGVKARNIAGVTPWSNFLTFTVNMPPEL
jgi:hypothetical protein